MQLSWTPDFLYDESLNYDKNDTIVVIALSPYPKQTIDLIILTEIKKCCCCINHTYIEICPIIQHNNPLHFSRSKGL